MKIETFEHEDHQKKIIAEFEAGFMEQYMRRAARKLASKTKIPGFRPGKAPYEVIRRTHGDAAIQEEAINIMLDEVYPQIISEAGIKAYGPGKLEEILSLDPPKFSFIIPLAPEIELGDYKAIRLEHTPPVIGEERVDEVVERLRRRTGTAVPVERAAEKGDLVAIRLSGHLLEPKEGEEAVLVEENSFEMVAGTPEDHTDNQGNEWPFEGFVNQLVGVSVGDTRTVQHTFSNDGSEDDLDGKTAEFTFTVDSIKEIHKADLNDEFAASLGPYESMEAMRKDILRQIQESESQTYNRQYVDSLVNQLVDGATVKYPPSLLEDEIEHTLGHFEEDLARQSMDLDTYLKTRQMTRDELIEKEVKEIAERSVKRQLVLEEFAAQENVQIQANEVQVVYDMAMNQAKSESGRKTMSERKMSTKQLADTLARGTINEIFNQRLLNRLRDIATGKADQPEPVAEAVAEEAAVVEAVSAEAPESAATGETGEAETAETAPAKKVKTPRARTKRVKEPVQDQTQPDDAA